MDLIYTNANSVDIGVLSAYSLDLSFGADENDFELTLGAKEPVLEFGAFIYIEGTEYGGIIDAMKTSTDGETVTYTGRTWHGILNSKVIQPDSGEDYYVVSGEANAIMQTLLTRLGLDDLFAASSDDSGITISSYKFNRYCYGYDGINSMLKAFDGKLKIEWSERQVFLSAVPVADYTDDPVDGDMAVLTVEQYENKVNHLICLGQGELKDRQVIHLYVNQYGGIGTEQYYTGVDERIDIYENTSAATLDELESGGIERLKELWAANSAEVDIPERVGLVFDIGDIIGATEMKSGIKVVEPIKQKIVRINNGTISTEYKTSVSGSSQSNSGSGSGSGTGGGTGSSELPIASAETLGGVKVGDNLSATEDGTLSVETTDTVEEGNTKPISSAGVYTQLSDTEERLAEDIQANTDNIAANTDAIEANAEAIEANATAIDGKAPTSHASTATTYGKATGSNYGHVKLSASTSSTSGASSGVAATPSAVKKAYDQAVLATDTRLGGNRIIIGSFSMPFGTSSQSLAVSFGVTFSSKPAVVTAQVFDSNNIIVRDDNITTTGFTAKLAALSSSGTRTVWFIAIGPA